jgi:hypothetical protein
LSVVRPPAADPARTDGVPVRVADVCSAPVLRGQGPERPAGHGKADAGIERNSRLLVGLVVDLSTELGQLARPRTVPAVNAGGAIPQAGSTGVRKELGELF